MRKIFLVVLVILVFNFNSHSQNKVEISAGVGFAEFLNAGVHYNFTNKFQVAGKFGILALGDNQNVYSISGNIYYYYTGVSKHTNQPPWYLLFGTNYTIDDTGEGSEEDLIFLNLRHGRVLNFSPSIGLKLDFGLSYIVELSLMPTANIELFYRF